MREVLSLAKRRRRCVLALLDAGANVDAVRADGMRPINRALKLSNHTAKRAGILAGGRLARGATYNIYIAAVNGDHDYVKKELLRVMIWKWLSCFSSTAPIPVCRRKERRLERRYGSPFIRNSRKWRSCCLSMERTRILRRSR